MSTLYIVEAANLFCGSHDPQNSKHLSIRELKLPPLQETFGDHQPGGSRVKIEIETGVDTLKPTFKLVGFDHTLLRQFGIGTRTSMIYTAYGEIKDRRTGRSIELRAVMEGRLGKVEGDAIQRGELQSHDYDLNSLTHYEIHVDGQEEIFWDFFTNTWRVGGIDQNATTNSILRIPRVG